MADNESVQNETTVTKVVEATPVTPATTVQTTTTQTVPQKKSSCLKVGLISCGVIALLLICLCAGTYFGMAILLQATTKKDDFNRNDYTHLTADQFGEDSQGIYEKFIIGKELNENEEFTITVSEKDLLSTFVSDDSSDTDVVQAFYVQMKKDHLSLKVDLEKFMEAGSTGSQGNNIDSKNFKDIFVSIDASVAADSKSFKVDSVSTGNGILDAILGDSIKTSIANSLNESLGDSVKSHGYEISRIEILDEAVRVTFTPTDSVMDLDTKYDY
jgi:hypothetical protein